ncbi:class II poly(R)-hydroxyalkanoic acid synthase [Pseudomaricurvus alkylphenolicus]|uniref:PHA/PHB synthase family protein n=1 Tax=Pseudomaricurvus alkylphenolicus TaxID=1306991 RepID=UPI00141E23F0|nr:alpha/beta fold hydrolase [Pseudomaricurvus alkylphenolicus]NIB40504.1 class II poly(R)-hydroxyalkanoic acid synthase [Pseudomaricurvus alkylphenolicus]
MAKGKSKNNRTINFDVRNLDALTTQLRAKIGPNPLLPPAGSILFDTFKDWASGLAGNPRLVRDLLKEAAVGSFDNLQHLLNLDHHPSDPRFSHPAYKENLLFRCLANQYWLTREVIQKSVDGSLSNEKSARAKTLANLIAEGMSPTNFFWTNPAAQIRALETGGASLITGLRQFVDDVVNNGAMPSMAKSDAYNVGKNLAITEGSVVYRSPVFEIIEYAPQTEEVYERPLLIGPSTVNKYYALDLAPGKSLVEWIVQSGFRVYMISWRNPQSEHRDWNLETYVSSLNEACQVVSEISGFPDLNLAVMCGSGVTAALMLAYHAKKKVRLVHAVTFLVAGIDSSYPSQFAALLDEKSVERAIEQTTENGVLSGRSLMRSFSMMRSHELIWNMGVNNYLLGKEPPGTEVLAWNMDVTNMPAGLHSDLLKSMLYQSFTKGATVKILNDTVSFEEINIDSYTVGAMADDTVPWQSTYYSMRLFRGKKRFALVSGGHVQCMVNSLGHPKAFYRINEGFDPNGPIEDWLKESVLINESWWQDWQNWLLDRAGDKIPASHSAGSRKYPPILPAPGIYVMEKG